MTTLQELKTLDEDGCNCRDCTTRTFKAMPALIAIIEELADRLKCPRDDTYITDIITRHLEKL